MSDSTETDGISPKRTPAFATFDRNTDALSSFLSTGLRSLGAIGEAIKEAASAAKDARASTETADEATLAPRSKSPEAGATFETIREPLAKASTLIDDLQTILQWVPVITVTAVETYLHDVLVHAAGVIPELMARSEQSATYAEVLEGTSIEQLADTLRSRWARKFVDDGGPSKWVDTLTRMGARGFPADMGVKMETLWGVRHLTVHSAGIATVQFVRRHPQLAATAGERIKIRFPQIREWAEVVYKFVEVTDQYFVQRCESRSS